MFFQMINDNRTLATKSVFKIDSTFLLEATPSVVTETGNIFLKKLLRSRDFS